MLKDFGWLKRVKIIDQDGNLITPSNPFPVTDIDLKRILWSSDTDFDKGTFDDTERINTGEDAKVQVSLASENSDDVPFTTPGNYTYDSDDIEIIDGKVQLKETVVEGDATTWDIPFTTPGDYTYDSDKIEVTEGKSQLTGTGDEAIDSSGNDRNGTLVNMESEDRVPGKIDNCLHFDGSNEYVNCGDIANFAKIDSFSFECWFKSNHSSSHQTILSKYDDNLPRGWQIQLNSNGNIYFGLWSTASNAIVGHITGNHYDNIWHHIVITYDGSEDISGISTYIDGQSKVFSTDKNALTGTIQNGSCCEIGARCGAHNLFNGYIDEVVIYDRVMDSTEVSNRYNSGDGTETLFGTAYAQYHLNGSYSTSNPTIYKTIGLTGAEGIWDFTGFIETATKPSGTEIKYILSNDDGTTWYYWNGADWVESDGTYSQANTASEINTNIGDFSSSNDKLNVKCFLYEDNGDNTPQLDNIEITYHKEIEAYPTGTYIILMNNDIQPATNYEYLSATETVTKPTNTEIKYQYSIDGGSTWNDSWLTKSELETALQGISCVADGSDKIRFKFQLSTTDNSVTPEIDNLNITSSAGYNTSGEFESNIYDSEYYSLDWGVVNFTIQTPAGTTLTLKIRASNDSSDMRDYSGGITSGADANVTGRYFQLKAEFTGVIESTAELNEFYVDFAEPYRREIRP